MQTKPDEVKFTLASSIEMMAGAALVLWLVYSFETGNGWRSGVEFVKCIALFAYLCWWLMHPFKGIFVTIGLIVFAVAYSAGHP